VLIALLLFFSLGLQAQWIESPSHPEDHQGQEDHPVVVSPYHYPIYNPLVSTITMAVLKPSKQPLYKTISIVRFPERAGLKGFENQHKLELAFFKQKNPKAPLLFLIPGIGGYALYPNTIYVGEFLYKAGFSVLTLPATLSWQFALGVSQSGYPGYSPRDAEDLLEFMKVAEGRLRKEEGITPSKYGLMGYSLGGLDSGFVANLNLQKNYFHFDRVLMINPPLQKAKSIDSLDGLFVGRGLLSIREQRERLEAAMREFREFSRQSLESLLKMDLERGLGLADTEISWLIGSSFRESLRDVIMVTQELLDLKILRVPNSRFLRGLRKAEAASFNFREYLDQFLFSQFTSLGLTQFHARNADELVEESDLREVLLHLSRKGQRWAVFHNENDFIFHDGDREFLLNSRSASRIYPLGGHLGNLWYEQNQYDIVRYFKPMLR
jgi:hypothetical protein